MLKKIYIINMFFLSSVLFASSEKEAMLVRFSRLQAKHYRLKDALKVQTERLKSAEISNDKKIECCQGLILLLHLNTLLHSFGGVCLGGDIGSFDGVAESVARSSLETNWDDKDDVCMFFQGLNVLDKRLKKVQDNLEIFRKRINDACTSK